MAGLGVWVLGQPLRSTFAQFVALFTEYPSALNAGYWNVTVFVKRIATLLLSRPSGTTLRRKREFTIIFVQSGSLKEKMQGAMRSAYTLDLLAPRRSMNEPERRSQASSF